MARFIELKPNECVNLDAVAMIDIDTANSGVLIYVNGNEYRYSDVPSETIQKLKHLLCNN